VPGRVGANVRRRFDRSRILFHLCSLSGSTDAGRVGAAERRFSLDRAMRNREYRAAVGVLVVLGVLWWKSQS
jgi:hypothetical protein